MASKPPTTKAPPAPASVKTSTGSHVSDRGAAYDQKSEPILPKLSEQQKKVVEGLQGRVRPEALNELKCMMQGGITDFHLATSNERQLCRTACTQAGVPLGSG